MVDRIGPQPRSGKVRIGPKKKIAFVCSGGATKAGAFHLGVALALQEQGFQFFGGPAMRDGKPREPGPMDISVYVGSSAGSIICTYLAAGYSIDNIFHSFMGHKPDPEAHYTPKFLPRLTYPQMFKMNGSWAKDQLRAMFRIRSVLGDALEGNWDSFLKFKWLKMTGLFSTSGIEQYLREDVLPFNRFQDYAADLYIVGTQLNHSRKIVFGKNHFKPPPHDPSCQYLSWVSVSQACAASTALTFIYEPYPIADSAGNTHHYIDGEIRETLSTHVGVDAGADLVIASHTHQPYHFSPELGSLTKHGLPAIVIQSIYLLIEQKINRHMHSKKTQKIALDAVSRYCKEAAVGEEHRRRILEILETELNVRPEVDTILIHPNPRDHRMFFNDHFTLSPEKMKEMAMSGFRAAIDALRKYDFSDRKERHAIGSAGVARTGGR
ncbi:MAG: patatin-like phospholipase family protein [Bdellovibrionales bacterium]|nr:patatin-like phospholipase family protein [Bdellovibrionales bacterium]